MRHIPKSVLLTLVLYAVATTVHFVHNAVFLDEYPNLPMWFTPAGVIGALLLIHLIGLLGVVLTSLSKPAIGLVFLAFYAIIGFDGLAHYSVATFSHHTLSMNVTILFEVTAAFLLLVAVIVALCTHIPLRKKLPR